MNMPIVFHCYTHEELAKLLDSWPFDSPVLHNLAAEVLHLRRQRDELQDSGAALLERARNAERERDEARIQHHTSELRVDGTWRALVEARAGMKERDEALAELGTVLDETAKRLTQTVSERDTARAEAKRLLALAREAIECWEDAAGYAAQWAREKHGHEAHNIAALRARLDDERNLALHNKT